MMIRVTGARGNKNGNSFKIKVQDEHQTTYSCTQKCTIVYACILKANVSMLRSITNLDRKWKFAPLLIQTAALMKEQIMTIGAVWTSGTTHKYTHFLTVSHLQLFNNFKKLGVLDQDRDRHQAGDQMENKKETHAKEEEHENHGICERELQGHVCMLVIGKKNSTLGVLDYVQAGHGNDTTLWLLQAEILLSGAGESKTSDMVSPSDSSLQQQLQASEEMQNVLSLKLTLG